MPEILKLIDAFDSAGKDMRRLVVELLGYFRNLLVYQAVGEAQIGLLDVTTEQLGVLGMQASLADPERVLRVAEQLVEAEELLKYTLSVRTRLETALIRCSRAATAVTLDEILRRLNALRQAEPVAAAREPVGTGTAANARKIMQDPVVKRALEMFDGKVVDVDG